VEFETQKEYKKIKHNPTGFFGWDNIPAIYQKAHRIKLRNMGIQVKPKEQENIPANKEF
jgi:hypothetical protein